MGSTSGLAWSSGALSILLQTSSALVLGSSGLAVNPDGVTITINGSNQLVGTPPGALYSANNSSAIANTAVTTAFSTAYTAASGQWNVLGRKLRWRCKFSVQATNSVADTLTLKITYGSTVVGQFALIPLGGAAAATPMTMEVTTVTTTTGASGVIQAAGLLIFDGGAIQMPMAKTTTTFSLTGALNLAVNALWSVASANDTITLDDITIEQLA